MRRGDVYLVNLEPVVGSEANKTRPAVIVSTDTANTITERLGRGMVTVVPITSNVKKVFDFQVYIATPDGGLDRDSKIQTEQIRSVDRTRLGVRLGQVPWELMDALDTVLRRHLNLEARRGR